MEVKLVVSSVVVVVSDILVVAESDVVDVCATVEDIEMVVVAAKLLLLHQ